jgi:hypothetical protein
MHRDRSAPHLYCNPGDWEFPVRIPLGGPTTFAPVGVGLIGRRRCRGGEAVMEGEAVAVVVVVVVVAAAGRRRSTRGLCPGS